MGISKSRPTMNAKTHKNFYKIFILVICTICLLCGSLSLISFNALAEGSATQ